MEDHQSPWCSVICWGTVSGLQLAFSDPNVLFWGKLTCVCGSFASSIPEKMNTPTVEVSIWIRLPNSRKRASNPFHNGFSLAHLAAEGANPRNKHSLSITKDRTWGHVDILLMQNSSYIFGCRAFFDEMLKNEFPCAMWELKLLLHFPSELRLAWHQNIPSSLICVMLVSSWFLP